MKLSNPMRAELDRAASRALAPAARPQRDRRAQEGSISLGDTCLRLIAGDMEVRTALGKVASPMRTLRDPKRTTAGRADGGPRESGTTPERENSRERGKNQARRLAGVISFLLGILLALAASSAR
jgi:hypothetical protein